MEVDRGLFLGKIESEMLEEDESETYSSPRRRLGEDGSGGIQLLQEGEFLSFASIIDD